MKKRWADLHHELKTSFIDTSCKAMNYRSHKKLLMIFNVGNPIMIIVNGVIYISPESANLMNALLTQYL